MTTRLAMALLLSMAPTLAQNCAEPQRTIRTMEPWGTAFFSGPFFEQTMNLFFDLDVQSPIEIEGFRIPTYDHHSTANQNPFQLGNIAEVRVFLIPGSWTGNEFSPVGWGVANPGSGQPEARAELTVVQFPLDSPIVNFKDSGGAPTTLTLAPGQYGVSLEVLPTSWAGTAAIPGQINVPLLNPGPLHTVIPSASAGPRSDAHITLSNDALLTRGWHELDAAAQLVPNTFMSTAASSGLNVAIDYAVQLPGLAGWESYGVGCHDSPQAVWERVDPGQVDLAATEWTFHFTPDAGGGHYVITPGGPIYDGLTAIQNGVDIAATPPDTYSSTVPWHNGARVHALSTTTFPNGFPFPGGSCSHVTLQSNGRILLGAITVNGSTFDPLGNIFEMQRHPQLAPMFCDIDVENWSDFRLESPSPNGGLRVTWHNVDSNQSSSDFQVELLPNGDVHFAYGSRLINDGGQNIAFIGFSPGGIETLPRPVDFSAITAYQTGSGTVSPRLGFSGDPLAGSTVAAVIDELGAGTGQPIGGFLTMAFSAAPAGISLGGYGLPGCDAYIDPATVLFSVLLANRGQGDMRWSWAVPAAGQGVQVRLQGGTFTPNAHNVPGILLTQAVCAAIGQ